MELDTELAMVPYGILKENCIRRTLEATAFDVKSRELKTYSQIANVFFTGRQFLGATKTGEGTLLLEVNTVNGPIGVVAYGPNCSLLANVFKRCEDISVTLAGDLLIFPNSGKVDKKRLVVLGIKVKYNDDSEEVILELPGRSI